MGAFVAVSTMSASSLEGLLGALLLLGTALLLGEWLLRRLGWRVGRHPADALLLAALLGLDVLSMAMLLFGYVGYPPAWLLRALMVLGSLLALRLGWRHRHHLQAFGVHLLRRRRLLLLLLPLLLLPLAKALLLPIGWDELVYHVAVPARWLADGRAHVYLDNPYSALASGMEFLYLLAMASGNAISPGSLNYLVWLMMLGMLYRLLRASSRPWTAGALTMTFAYSTVVLTLAYETYVELFLLLNILGALLVLRHYPLRRHLGTPLLAGALFGGFACGVKLTGVVLPVMLVPLLWQRRRQLRPTLKVAMACALLFLAILALYYARPWIATGNPVYPFYARLFTPDDRAALLVAGYHHNLSTAAYGARTFGDLLASPVQLAWMRNRYDGALGWPWLVVLAIALLATFRDLRRAWPWAAAGVVTYLLWLATAQQARFVLPAVVIAYLLAARGIAGLPRQARWLLPAILLFAALWDSRLGDPRQLRDQWSVIAGRQSMADYVQPWIGYDHVRAVELVHQETQPDDRVLMLMEKRTLYFDRRVELGTPFFQQLYLTPPELFEDSSFVVNYLREHGFDYLLIGLPARNPDILPAYDARMSGLIAAIGAAAASGHLDLIYQQPPNLVLWRIPPP